MIKIKNWLNNSSVLFKFKWFTFIKFLTFRCINNCSVYFLRKNNTFIKSKYSKNRQWSKVIVYFGLWFGVISVFVVVYYTYHFIFIFSYLWWIPVLWVFSILTYLLYRIKNYLNFNFFKIWK